MRTKKMKNRVEMILNEHDSSKENFEEYEKLAIKKLRLIAKQRGWDDYTIVYDSDGVSKFIYFVVKGEYKDSNKE